MASFLGDKALSRDVGCTGDFYFDIKDLVCISLGIVLPAGQFDGLDFVRRLMKWFGNSLRDRHMQPSRHTLIFFFE